MPGFEPKVLPFPRPEPGGLAARSDDELMELAAAGLREAFAALVARHERRVRSFCAKWDGARSEDLAQEAFLRLWQARARYRPDGQFAVYLFTIVRNVCRNARRGFFRRERVLQDAPAANEPSHRAEQLDALLRRERTERVHRELRGLSPKLREAVLLRFGEGLSYAEVGAIVDAPEATVRSRVFLGLRALRARLEVSA
ncbi:MAG: RNA polymerase sigma factor [Deltaproteobacteria bacterium]|nr:RNA polymerase sigma factor [Deltaproteobacteria bacterium]